MFRGIRNKIHRNLHKVKLDNTDFESLGLYLEKDYIFTVPPLLEEVEEIFVPGRDGSLTRHVRYLNREFSIEFNMYETQDYYKRLSYIESVLDNGGVLTINCEQDGFQVKRWSMDNLQRGIGVNKVTINFVCEPFLANINPPK
ncbi:MAG: hypothetical protein RSE41_05035 [Clostridia bacterium]